jgi:hypothetical protein
MLDPNISIRLDIIEEHLNTERALSLLQADLAAVPHLSVRRVVSRGEAPPATKGAFQDVAIIITASIPALSVFASVLRTWLKSQATQSIKLTIGQDSVELSGPWSDAHDRALDRFLKKQISDASADQGANNTENPGP